MKLAGDTIYSQVLDQKVKGIRQFPGVVSRSLLNITGQIRIHVFRQHIDGPRFSTYFGRDEHKEQIACLMHWQRRCISITTGGRLDGPAFIELRQYLEFTICLKRPPVIRTFNAARARIYTTLTQRCQSVRACVDQGGPFGGHSGFFALGWQGLVPHGKVETAHLDLDRGQTSQR